MARRRDPDEPLVGTSGERLLLDPAAPWQVILAHYFIDHLMRVQPDWGFFHAATVALGGAGVFIGGDKGAGKSSLSLALAARGHGFLGDEIAGVHTASGEIAPFPRAVSIRSGPQAREVAQYLERTNPQRHRLPDGSDRIRVPVSRLFPNASPRRVHLTHAFFLEGLAGEPHAERFEFAARDLRFLSPLHGTLGAGAPAQRVVQFLNLFGAVECYRLRPGGGPDQTAELIESIVEGAWDTASRKRPNASARSAGSKSS